MPSFPLSVTSEKIPQNIDAMSAANTQVCLDMKKNAIIRQSPRKAGKGIPGDICSASSPPLAADLEKKCWA